MMRILASLSIVLLLSACSLFPSNFDYNEQAKIADIVEWTKRDVVCNNTEQTRALVQRLDNQAEWLVTYGRSLPNNEKLVIMYTNLDAITSDMIKRYEDTTRIPSVMYCKVKIKTINEAASTMLPVSGRRPR